MLYKHEVFSIDDERDSILFIPTLGRILRVSKDKVGQLPDFVLSEEQPPHTRWESLPDYAFFGVNLILTNGCNLACSYCSTECGPAKNEKMRPEVALSAVDYIIDSALRNGHKLVYVNFFGGEPTQAFDLIEETHYYLKKKATEAGLRSRTTITTNGAMKLEQARWLNANADLINLSMDGYKIIQDKQRSRSFDEVFPIAQEIYASVPRKLHFRTTVSTYSVQYLPDIVEFFGRNFPGCPQMYEPVFAIGRGKNKTGMTPDYNMFFAKFLESVSIAVRYHARLKTSALSLRARTGHEFCGVAARNFMVTPDGFISTCNRMADVTINTAASKFIYGRFDDIRKTFVFDDAKYQWLKNATVASVPGCQNCFARASCKGDCVANKAVLDPENFWRNQSYRCVAIKMFVKNVLVYILDHGTEGLLI